MAPTLQTPQCPECASQKVWKDGLRNIGSGPVQRYVCRECGYRFSKESSKNEPSPPINRAESSEALQKIQTMKLNRTTDKGIGCLVCAAQPKRARNLATVEPQNQEKIGGTTTPDSATIKGLIIQFAFWLKKEGNTSPEYPRILQRLVKRGANLLDPESVKEAIAKHQCKNGTKLQDVYAYDSFAKMMNIQWSRPHYTQEENLPFIPEERELDQLIAACKSKRMAAFLQTLKETFADPGEALKLRWIDLTGNVVSITPVKGHSPRQLTISNRLVAMLNCLPRTSERIFSTTYTAMASSFVMVRNRATNVLKNPRIKAISFRTFRHWGATMTYHHTKNILLVKEMLGHKDINNTMKYTRLIQFEEDDYEIATATSIDEDQELLKVGFEYVTERNSIKIYRKPKAFGHLVNKRQN